MESMEIQAPRSNVGRINAMRNKKIFLWTILVLVLLGTLFFLLWWFIWRKKHKGPTPGPKPKPKPKPGPPPKPKPGPPLPITEQPEKTVQIINKSESPLYVYIEYSNLNLNTTKKPYVPILSPPTDQWKIIQLSSSNINLENPKYYYPPAVPNVPAPALPSGVQTFLPNDVGSATWQILHMPSNGDWAILQIPNFLPNEAWSIRPLKYITHEGKVKPCAGGGIGDWTDCGMPTLIEAGVGGPGAPGKPRPDMVADMSAVDGVNYLIDYELTAGPQGQGKPTTINFQANPCLSISCKTTQAVGCAPSTKGCINPSVNGIFASGKDAFSPPCPAGTCNLIDLSKTWCNAIHTNQCANSKSHWTKKQQGSGGPNSCSDHNLFTTYCYTHDDATSSPYLRAPYKMKLTYRDLPQS